MRKYLILLLALSTTSHAGFLKLTHHSRANCGNNETISWHLGHSYNMNISSMHFDISAGETKPYDHFVCDNPDPKKKETCNLRYTSRSAAICWGEMSKGIKWKVRGYHYIKYVDKPPELVGTTTTDCSIGEGW